MDNYKKAARRVLTRKAKGKPEKLNLVMAGMLKATVGSIVAPGGHCKSALALMICSDIAAGCDHLGLDLISGKATYLSGEDPEEAMDHRLYALSALYTDEQCELIDERLTVEQIDSESIDICTSEWFEKIKELAIGREVMVIDTLIKIHKKSEKDNNEMALVLEQMKFIALETGCAILFLHHVNKSSSQSGMGDDQSAARGASVLTDNIRWQGYMQKMTDVDAQRFGVPTTDQHNYLRFGVSKQNYGKKFSPIYLTPVSCDDPDIDGGFTLHKVEFAVNNVNKKGGSFNKNNSTARPRSAVSQLMLDKE